MKRKICVLVLVLTLCVGLGMQVSAAPGENALASAVAVSRQDLSWTMGGFVVSVTDSTTYVLVDSIVLTDSNGNIASPWVYFDNLWEEGWEYATGSASSGSIVWVDEEGNIALLAVPTTSAVTAYHTAPALAPMSTVSDGDTLYRLWILDDADNLYGEIRAEFCVQYAGEAILSDSYPAGTFSMTTPPIDDLDNFLSMGSPVVNEDGVAVGISAYVQDSSGEWVDTFVVSLDELIDYMDANGIPYTGSAAPITQPGGTTEGQTQPPETGSPAPLPTEPVPAPTITVAPPENPFETREPESNFGGSTSGSFGEEDGLENMFMRVITGLIVVIVVIIIGVSIGLIVYFSNKKKKANAAAAQNYGGMPQNPPYGGPTVQTPPYTGVNTQTPPYTGANMQTPPYGSATQTPPYGGPAAQAPNYGGAVPPASAYLRKKALVGQGGVMHSRVIPLEPGMSLVFGTDVTRCNIIYPDTSAEISPVHCQLVFQNGMWLLADLGSASGTYLRGQRMEPNGGYQLNTGDVFCLGSQENAFVVQEA